MKPAKIILIITGTVVTLIIATLIYVTSVMDPNDYKQSIISQAKEKAGLDVKIDGNIQWRFLPNIGITVGHSSVDNPSGFGGGTMLEFNKIDVDIAFWPLLSKKVKVGVITVDGFKANLVTNAKGVSNLDSLNSAKADAPQQQPTVKPSAIKKDSTIPDLDVLGIRLVHANISIKNQQLKTQQSLSKLQFSLGHLSLGNDVPLQFSTHIDTGDMVADIQSSGKINIAKTLNQFNLIELNTQIELTGEELLHKRLTLDSHISALMDTDKNLLKFSKLSLSVLGIDLTGTAQVQLDTIPTLDYNVQVGAVDLDKILPAKPQNTATKTAPANTQDLDLSWMKSIHMNGQLGIKSIKVKGLSMINIQVPLQLKNGILKLSGVKADLYQGKLLSNATLNAQTITPSFSNKSELSGVNALPLSRDLLEKELISGIANLSFEIAGTGLDEKNIRAKTQGKGQFSFKNGAIQGVNIAQLIRRAYTTFKGQTLAESNEPNQTDFASLSGSFTLKDGLFNNPDLDLSSPLLRIQGKGDAQIIAETIDYHLTTSIVATLDGQGGKPMTELNNISIPLLIKGTFQEPKFSLDMKSLFNQQVKEKVDANKEKVKDKLKNKIKGLLGG